MKQIIKDEGLVIHTMDYLDNAVIATILTKNRRVDCVIKGAKKLTSSTARLSQPLTFISFNHTSNPNMVTLTEGVVKENYSNIKQNLDSYNQALIILDDLYHFIDSMNDYQTIYEFTLAVFKLMNSIDYSKALRMLYEIKITYLLGIPPILSYCMKCHNKIDNGYLSIKDGGMVCSNCLELDSMTLNNESSMIFKKAYTTKLKDITIELLKELNDDIMVDDFIETYYQYHLEFNSKVKEILRDLDI